MKKLMFLMAFICLSTSILLAEEPSKVIIGKEQAIDIAKETLIKKMSSMGQKWDANEDDVNAIFHQTGDYKNWVPHPVIYKSKDFKDDTGIVAAAEKVAEEAKKVDESGNGYWEVTFIPKKDHIGGCVVRVDSKTGQSDGPMYLR